MRHYILKHKWWLFVTVFFRVVGAAMQVAVALLIQNIIDNAINKDINGFTNAIIFSAIFFVVMTLNDYLNKTTQFIY